MTEYNDGKTDDTNLLVDYLANSQKINSTEDRWHYVKNDDNNNNNYNDDDIDDNFKNYVTHNDIPVNNSEHYTNNNTQNNTQNNTNDDRTEKPNDTTQNSTNKFIDDEYENLSPLEKRLRRLDIMRSLGELRDLGCKVTNYNIDDDYYMMKYELDLHRSIRSKRNWLGLYSHMLIGVVKGVELLNNNYNPFDFTLKGLSDEVNADKNTYYEILGEIYEFHNVPGKKMNPWFRLMISIIGVVVVVGGKNNAHKFIPNKAEEVEDDEDYIEKLRSKAAKDSQSQMSHKQNKQNNQNNQNNQNQNNLDDYMNKQHESAVQRAKDLEELKRQELEYQRYQQFLAQKKDGFNNIKKNLELTASPSAKSQSSKRESIKSSQKSSNRVSRNKKEQLDTMSEMTSTTNDTTKSTQSGISQISINRNLANKLKLNMRDKSKKKSDISLDQISFGSNKKK